MNTLIGDLASVDQDKIEDLATAKQHGLAGLIVRATYSTWKDPEILRLWDKLAELGLKRGMYIMPDYSASAPEIETQVDVAYDYAKLVPGQDMPGWLDIEFSRGIKATGRDRAGLAKFIGRGLAHMRARQNGAAPGAYCSARVVETDDTDTLAHAADVVLKDDVWAWYARYIIGARQPALIGDVDHIPEPPVTKALGAPEFDQYQGDAIRFPGFSSTVDCDVYRPLMLGAHGPRVVRVQRRLPGLKFDGGYGPLTTGAVKQFQADHGLMPTGDVDLDTWLKLAWLIAAPLPVA